MARLAWGVSLGKVADTPAQSGSLVGIPVRSGMVLLVGMGRILGQVGLGGKSGKVADTPAQSGSLVGIPVRSGMVLLVGMGRILGQVGLGGKSGKVADTPAQRLRLNLALQQADHKNRLTRIPVVAGRNRLMADHNQRTVGHNRVGFHSQAARCALSVHCNQNSLHQNRLRSQVVRHNQKAELAWAALARMVAAGKAVEERNSCSLRSYGWMQNP